MTAVVSRLPLVLAVLAVLPSAARTHVLDEYLQSTLVAIEPGEIRLEINLTPGVEIADKVLAKIDSDQSGVISPDEAAAYAEALRSDLVARIDGRDCELKLSASNFPELSELKTGHGIIQLVFSLTSGSLAEGPHKVSVENRHHPSLGAYLFNAAKPNAGSIQIIKQTRNKNQSTGEIEFAVAPPANSPLFAGVIACLAAILATVIAGAWWLRRNSPRSTDTRHLTPDT